jgi:hypothetical protein
MSNKNPPVFAYRKNPIETYTAVNIDDDTSDKIILYSKLTFVLLVLMFIVMMCSLVYVYKKGIPVRLRG